MNKASINKISEKFNALPERGRLLILVGAVVVLLFGWIYFLFIPMNHQLKLLSSPKHAAEVSLEKINDGYKELMVMDKNPPIAQLKKQEKDLLVSFEKMRANPAYSKKMLLPYDKLRGLLQAVMSTEPELTLVHLEELADSKILIEFSGDYFSCVRFFQRLESQAWYFFYDDFDYKVNDYPDARIRLVVHTLNIKEGSK